MESSKEDITGEKAAVNTKKGSSVLITGGSGLVGRYLTSLLLSEGYKVSHLSRKADQFGKVRVYRWDPEKGIIDPVILEGIDYIVHLAGANIGEKRWTKTRKREIINSRVDSARLLFRTIIENRINLRAFISASAIGYYGSVTSDRILREEDPSSDDFLGTTCKLWEEAADQFGNTGIRTVKIRSAVVFEKDAIALKKLRLLARFGIFPLLGNGRNYIPWIHIEDLCHIYLNAIRDTQMEGAYNAVSPQHGTQKELMRSMAIAMNKFFFHPRIPAILLHLVLGEVADAVMKGSRVSSEKIIKAGYDFIFRDREDALREILISI